LELAADDADLIALVKPQFEADGPSAIGKGGIVKDPAARAEAVAKVSAWLESAGWSVKDTTESPIPGGDGNLESLLWAHR
ncbi:MAG: SAM-dependent methyltransferase, partial [Brevundimonas sp.]